MAHSIRQKQLVCTDEKKIDQFLTEAQTGYLGMSADEYPYVQFRLEKRLHLFSRCLRGTENGHAARKS
ncbi:hypothetical protein CHCC14821_3364 [Bacillus paralicheniformis]|nr:hypothetical protein CHCC14821_3364 [Bacillus paralicheniformis]